MQPDEDALTDTDEDAYTDTVEDALIDTVEDELKVVCGVRRDNGTDVPFPINLKRKGGSG